MHYTLYCSRTVHTAPLTLCCVSQLEEYWVTVLCMMEDDVDDDDDDDDNVDDDDDVGVLAVLMLMMTFAPRLTGRGRLGSGSTCPSLRRWGRRRRTRRNRMRRS